MLRQRLMMGSLTTTAFYKAEEPREISAFSFKEENNGYSYRLRDLLKR